MGNRQRVTLMAMLVAATNAYALGQGEAILRVDRLALDNGQGTPFTLGSFASLQVSSVFGNSGYIGPPEHGGMWQYSSSLGNADLPAICGFGHGGQSCNPVLQNYFAPFSDAAYTFHYADYDNSDQQLRGQLLADTPSSLAIDTRGDVGIEHEAPGGKYGSESTADMTLTFRLAHPDRLRLSFDADPYTKVWHNGAHTDLTSEVRFTATLTNATTGETVFSFAPGDINFRNRVYNDFVVLDPAAASYDITSALLNDADQYQLVISQYAGSYNGAGAPPVPEPSQWAMLGAGLGLLTWTRRRRR
ncbi:putative secreted protein with PEP-CTERM sorting signal/MYXO-CTERM domain-containing protein [Pseudoduganella flava]|uniref:PEP-CTERM sorting domain-containing protein n=1 Tax=Pseudoduganella flava TaxID=871742 RepID=A0A562PXL6_9BURK|nr:EDSAP-1 family PEP-CTERM protein [Pseudoduganella flava]QGZ39893.1 PEP-CTERM sorting domain-containing protein [Pseudoduganella flava]TWI48826.1 putative secreted protein with PEP-CTERM sorting signal/MYXO-CTERM domain-containing protein [Pseudoduganella flava]